MKIMMELTINGQVYQFNFGMGFLREMNKNLLSQKKALKGKVKKLDCGMLWPELWMEI